MTARRNKLGAAAAAAGFAIVLVLTGCSSNSGSASSATSGAPNADGLKHAQEQVAAYTKVTAGFIPTSPINDISSVAGKTVIYIPAVAQIPTFVATYDALVKAFSVVGVKVQLCDAQANPSKAASCLQQAVSTQAAGVMLDQLPPEIAQQDYNAVVTAGIPVVLGTTPVPSGSPDTVQTVGPDPTFATRLGADSIIANSQGKANVLGLTVIDSSSTKGWMENGALKEFATYCPTCNVTSVQTKTADLQNVPSLVSSALLAKPSIDYLFPSFSVDISPTLQGATNTGKKDLPLVATGTTLSDLQLLATGKNLYATVGWDVVRTGWLSGICQGE